MSKVGLLRLVTSVIVADECTYVRNHETCGKIFLGMP